MTLVLLNKRTCITHPLHGPRRGLVNGHKFSCYTFVLNEEILNANEIIILLLLPFFTCYNQLLLPPPSSAATNTHINKEGRI